MDKAAKNKEEEPKKQPTKDEKPAAPAKSSEPDTKDTDSKGSLAENMFGAVVTAATTIVGGIVQANAATAQAKVAANAQIATAQLALAGERSKMNFELMKLRMEMDAETAKKKLDIEHEKLKKVDTTVLEELKQQKETMIKKMRDASEADVQKLIKLKQELNLTRSEVNPSDVVFAEDNIACSTQEFRCFRAQFKGIEVFCLRMNGGGFQPLAKEDFDKLEFLQMERHVRLVFPVGVFVKEGQLHLITEYPPGEPIAAMLPTGVLKHEHMDQVCSGILEGLDVLHKKNRAHGDISLHSIKIFGESDVKLMFWGFGDIAAVRKVPQSSSKSTALTGRSYVVRSSQNVLLTNESAVDGKVADFYKAPELMAHKVTKPNAATDLYSLGMVVYCMLMADQGASVKELMPPIARWNEDIKGGIRPKLADQVKEAHPVLSSIYQRCVEGDPNQRKSTSELLNAIKTGKQLALHTPYGEKTARTDVQGALPSRRQ